MAKKKGSNNQMGEENQNPEPDPTTPAPGTATPPPEEENQQPPEQPEPVTVYRVVGYDTIVVVPGGAGHTTYNRGEIVPGEKLVEGELERLLGLGAIEPVAE